MADSIMRLEGFNELAAALRMAERDRQLRCVVITGAGRAFCSGQDLRVVHERHTAVVATTVDPTGERHLLADEGLGDFSGMMCSISRLAHASTP